MDAIQEQFNILTTVLQSLIVGVSTLKSIRVLQSSHTEKMTVKEALHKVADNIKLSILGLVFPEIINFINTTIYFRAGDGVTWETSNLVAGSLVLFGVISKMAIIFEVSIVTIVFSFHLKQYQNGEERDRAEHKKAAKTTIIVGILVVTITGITNFITSIYG